jgi:hypothetical protein
MFDSNPPIPEPAREALFKCFAPSQYMNPAARAARLAETKNKDCLVRLYLGRRMNRKESSNFKLRNFDLMINEMERLGVNTELYATIMTDTLAMLHWGVSVDANDVEFVLGSTPSWTSRQPGPNWRDLHHDRMNAGDHRLEATYVVPRNGQCSVWLLDFNQCKEFKHDEAGVKQLVDGFWWNDPYYPRPVFSDKRDEKLWCHFKKVYLTKSKVYEQGNKDSMAARFIEEVEKSSKKQTQQLFW